MSNLAKVGFIPSTFTSTFILPSSSLPSSFNSYEPFANSPSFNKVDAIVLFTAVLYNSTLLFKLSS